MMGNKLKMALSSIFVMGVLVGSFLLGRPTLIYADISSNVQRHSKEEIQAYLSAHPYNIDMEDAYDIAPDGTRDVAGKLSESTVQNALNEVNYYRYIAGVREAKVLPEYTDLAQKASALMMATDTLSHGNYNQPNGMSETFFQEAKAATAKSNIAVGAPHSIAKAVKLWVDDDNVNSLGHRRWALHPNMTEIGLGSAGKSAKGAVYSAMYFNYGEGTTLPWMATPNSKYLTLQMDNNFVTWPAQNMPVNLAPKVWSVQLNRNVFRHGNVTITMKNVSTGQTQILPTSMVTYDEASSYGDAIVFRPNVSMKDKDTYEVSIKGLLDANTLMESEELVYTVHFFDMTSTATQNTSNTQLKKSTINHIKYPTSTHALATTKVISGLNMKPEKSFVWQFTNGRWTHDAENGQILKDTWSYLYNSFSGTKGWFRFGKDGTMLTGWIFDQDENWYYLNPVSDNNLGVMLIGWQWIRSGNIEKCYYFNPVSDGTKGRLLTNTNIDGYSVNENGEWVVDGIVQTREVTE